MSRLDAPATLSYVYDFNAMDTVPEGPLSASVAPRRMLSGASATTGKSLTTGAVVTGRALHCSIVHNARGTGSKLHTHPNEQFNYVLSGTLIADIDGQVMRVSPGQVIHIPAGMVHSHVSSADGDVVFLAAKDTRHGITGPAVDGKYDGPRTLPGFGAHSGNDWTIGADGLPEPQSPRVNAERVRYVYDPRGCRPNVSELRSARVVLAQGQDENADGGQPRLCGEKVSVSLTHIFAGALPNPSCLDRERFVVVLTGVLRADIAGHEVAVPRESALHVPAGTACALTAQGGNPATCMVIEEIR